METSEVVSIAEAKHPYSPPLDLYKYSDHTQHHTNNCQIYITICYYIFFVNIS